MIGAHAHRSALEIARLTRWRGERRVARALLALAVAVMLALAFAPWQQNAVGTGRVIAFSPNERQLVVQAPIEGRVERWLFQEGDRVERGEVIVELADNDPRVLLRYEAQRDAALRRVDAARAARQALASRIASLRAQRTRAVAAATSLVEVAESERVAAGRGLRAAEAKRHAAALQLDRIEALAREGLESERSLELARRNATEAEADRAASRAALDAARARVRAKRAARDGQAASLDAEIAGARNDLEAAGANLAAAESDVAGAERALARQRSLDVRAPRSGMLTHVAARERSAYVMQGEALATVVPTATERAVELNVTGRDAPLVVPGQAVRLQFEGWPAIQLGGWPKAAVGTFPGQVAFVDAQATPSGRFRVVVRPTGERAWPHREVLRQGNQVNGWILLDRVPLGYELWRQLNGFPPNLPPAARRAAGYTEG